MTGFNSKREAAADKLQEPVCEALKLALEALESSRVFVTTREKIKHPEGTKWYDERITAIKEALAQPAQEPISCARCKDLEEQAYDLLSQLKAANLKWSVAHPWVGLTAEDFSAIKFPAEMLFPPEFRAGARWAEAKLKDKNT